MARRLPRALGSIAVLVLTAGVASAQDDPAGDPPIQTTGWAISADILDLNTASRDELTRFKGIGLLYADKIIRGRPYQARSELVSRSIIPASLYLRIKHQLYATPPAPAASALRDFEPADGRLDVNHATRDELRSFKGIGQMWADKIISGRPYKAAIELVGRRVMPLSAYERIQSGIVARP